MDKKLDAEKDMVQFKTQEEMKVELVRGWMQAIGKGVIASTTVMPILKQLMPNITLPLMEENKEIVQIAQENEIDEQQQQALPPQPMMQPQQNLQPQMQ